jgi:hypothetical protein
MSTSDLTEHMREVAIRYQPRMAAMWEVSHYGNQLGKWRHFREAAEFALAFWALRNPQGKLHIQRRRP